MENVDRKKQTKKKNPQEKTTQKIKNQKKKPIFLYFDIMSYFII